MKEWKEQLEYLQSNNINKLYISEGKYYTDINNIHSKDLICCIECFKTKKGEDKLKLSFKAKKNIVTA